MEYGLKGNYLSICCYASELWQFWSILLWQKSKYNNPKYFKPHLTDKVSSGSWGKDLRLSLLDGRTNEWTNTATPWAPDGAKKNMNNFRRESFEPLSRQVSASNSPKYSSREASLKMNWSQDNGVSSDSILDTYSHSPFPIPHSPFPSPQSQSHISGPNLRPSPSPQSQSLDSSRIVHCPYWQ